MKTEQIITLLQTLPADMKFSNRRILYNYLVDNFQFSLTFKAFNRRYEDYNSLKEEVLKRKQPVITGATVQTITKTMLSIDDIYDNIVAEHNKNQKLEEIKQVQKIAFHQDRIGLVHISCAHLSTANIEQLFVDTEKILKSPNLYIALIGDLTDNFIQDWTLKINLNRNTSIPNELSLVKFWLNKIKNKLLLCVEGNHDLWTNELSGNSFIHEYFKDSNFHILYDKYEIPLTVDVKGYKTNWIFRHNFKGNTPKSPFGGSKNYITSYPQNDYDYTVSGHIHSGSLVNQFMFGNKVRTCLLVNTYKQHDDYGKSLGATPIHNKPLMVSIIDSKTKEVLNTSNLDLAIDLLK